jgi:hypothetical protein
LRPGGCSGASNFQDDPAFGARQAYESSRVLGNLAEVAKPKAFADDVEEVAVLTGRGIGPLARGPLWGFLKSHEHRTARSVVDVANSQ